MCARHPLQMWQKYKGESNHLLQIKLEENQKELIRGETMKDMIILYREKGNDQHQLNEFKKCQTVNNSGKLKVWTNQQKISSK